MNDPIYFVTVMTSNRDERRCWGWFPDLADAIKAVIHDVSDMHEGIFDLLVIESIRPGIGCNAKALVWFRHEDGGWRSIFAPKEAANITNYAIG